MACIFYFNNMTYLIKFNNAVTYGFGVIGN